MIRTFCKQCGNKLYTEDALVDSVIEEKFDPSERTEVFKAQVKLLLSKFCMDCFIPMVEKKREEIRRRIQ